MHSAEHILNQAMGRLFECERCFNAHIEKKKSKCDYYFSRPLSAEEIQTLEMEVNAAIEADLEISESFIPVDEAGNRYNLSKLPENTGETIRIIHIGNYDRCPCIGPHVPSTGKIGQFRITSTSFENGVLRIRFKLDRIKQRSGS